MLRSMYKKLFKKCDHEFIKAHHIYGETVTYGVCCIKCGKFPTGEELVTIEGERNGN